MGRRGNEEECGEERGEKGKRKKIIKTNEIRFEPAGDDDDLIDDSASAAADNDQEGVNVWVIFAIDDADEIADDDA